MLVYSKVIHIFLMKSPRNNSIVYLLNNRKTSAAVAYILYIVSVYCLETGFLEQLQQQRFARPCPVGFPKRVHVPFTELPTIRSCSVAGERTSTPLKTCSTKSKNNPSN